MKYLHVLGQTSLLGIVLFMFTLLHTVPQSTYAVGICNSNDKCWRSTDFDMGDILGTGSNGEVMFAIERESMYVVLLKEVETMDGSEEMLTEVFVMDKICNADNPNIIQFYGYFAVDKENKGKYFILIMEPALNGDLKEFTLRGHFGGINFAEEVLRVITYGTLKGLEKVHQQGYLHRDMKEDNILLTQDATGDLLPKLADFGWTLPCEEMEDPEEKDRGTPIYVAPEMYIQRLIPKNSPACVPATIQKADVFGVGMVLNNIITYDNGRRLTPTFYGAVKDYVGRFGRMTKDSIAKYYLGIVKEKSVRRWLNGWFKQPSELLDSDSHLFSEELIDLIAHLLVFDPDERYSIRQALSHPWFKTKVKRKKMYTDPSEVESKILSWHHWSANPDAPDFFSSFVRRFGPMSQRKNTGGQDLNTEEEETSFTGGLWSKLMSFWTPSEEREDSPKKTGGWFFNRRDPIQVSDNAGSSNNSTRTGSKSDSEKHRLSMAAGGPKGDDEAERKL